MHKNDQEKRLAEALRANLRRRKAQARDVDSTNPAERDSDSEHDHNDRAR